jgi:GNAT superfamily N-acetyltransferase
MIAGDVRRCRSRVAIRTGLRPGDLARVVALHDEIYPLEFGRDHRLAAHVASAMADFADALAADGAGDPPARLWLVEAGDELVGAIAITPDSSEQARLRWFVVARSRRGAGVGGGLLRQAIEFARDAGYQSIALMTFSALTAAARAYEHAGFRRVSARPGREFLEGATEEHWELRLQRTEGQEFEPLHCG